MMGPCYIGRVNFAPKDCRDPDMWRLEEPFGQVTKDGHLILCRMWQRTDGASIPRLLWPLLGHPFEGGNAFWSQPHDQGYNGQCLVLGVRGLRLHEVVRLVEDPDAAADYRDLERTMPRVWFDLAMREAMHLTGEPLWKRTMAFGGVRLGGGKPWRKARDGEGGAAARPYGGIL